MNPPRIHFEAAASALGRFYAGRAVDYRLPSCRTRALVFKAALRLPASQLPILELLSSQPALIGLAGRLADETPRSGSGQAGATPFRL